MRARMHTNKHASVYPYVHIEIKKDWFKKEIEIILKKVLKIYVKLNVCINMNILKFIAKTSLKAKTQENYHFIPTLETQRKFKNQLGYEPSQGLQNI